MWAVQKKKKKSLENSLILAICFVFSTYGPKNIDLSCKTTLCELRIWRSTCMLITPRADFVCVWVVVSWTLCCVGTLRLTFEWSTLSRHS